MQGFLQEDASVKGQEDPYDSNGTTHWVQDWMYPLAGCIPIANVIMGLWHIKVAIQGDTTDDNVRTEDLTKYRIIKGLVGVAEITLVGGILVHGVATAYFYITKPTTEEARRILIERDAARIDV